MSFYINLEKNVRISKKINIELRKYCGYFLEHPFRKIVELLNRKKLFILNEKDSFDVLNQSYVTLFYEENRLKEPIGRIVIPIASLDKRYNEVRIADTLLIYSWYKTEANSFEIVTYLS